MVKDIDKILTKVPFYDTGQDTGLYLSINEYIVY